MPYYESMFGGGNYSTTEQKTGKKWIDGKDEYIKVIDFGALPNASEKTVNTGISNMAQLIDIWGIFKSGSGASLQYGPIPIISKDSLGNQVGMSLKSGGAQVSIISGIDRSSMTAYVFIKYTKSS